MKKDLIQDLLCTLFMVSGVFMATHSFGLCLATFGLGIFLSNIRSDIVE
jgi:hypothetical protein